eukprot:TRINITY_DN6393_c0_g1_i7.p3 TRINITY_DN6393_c0_g1~~TRINITY_DN6393_c0_g1_i7.p3  ORF type:complete len:261 (-),score=-0.85 TRINITY_DN6393_c0_g1_i7:31-813(-)
MVIDWYFDISILYMYEIFNIKKWVVTQFFFTVNFEEQQEFVLQNDTAVLLSIQYVLLSKQYDQIKDFLLQQHYLNHNKKFQVVYVYVQYMCVLLPQICVCLRCGYPGVNAVVSQMWVSRGQCSCVLNVGIPGGIGCKKLVETQFNLEIKICLLSKCQIDKVAICTENRSAYGDTLLGVEYFGGQIMWQQIKYTNRIQPVRRVFWRQMWNKLCTSYHVFFLIIEYSFGLNLNEIVVYAVVQYVLFGQLDVTVVVFWQMQKL